MPCPRQKVESAATAAADSAADAAQAAAIGAAVGSAIMNILMSASLSQIWGMINGIQFILNTPTLNIDLPGNGFSFLKSLLTIACFDIPYLNMGTVSFFYKIDSGEDVLTDLPNNVVSSMDQLGYNDPNLSVTFGSVYVFTLLSIIGLVTIVITLPLLRFSPILRLHNYLKETLLWNFLIRLIFEGALESTFCLYITFKYGGGLKTREFFGSNIDYVIACIMTVSLALFPVFIGNFYLEHYFKWEDEEFDEKYGAPLDGLNKNKKMSIVYPVYFIIRRVSFVFVAMYLWEHVHFQLTIHAVLTAVSFAYLANFEPFEDRLQNNLDMLNEFVTIMVVDLCFIFTKLEPDVRRQYNFGFVFIGIVIACISTHIYFLFRDMINTLKLTIKRNNNNGWTKYYPWLKRFQCPKNRNKIT